MCVCKHCVSLYLCVYNYLYTYYADSRLCSDVDAKPQRAKELITCTYAYIYIYLMAAANAADPKRAE